MCAYGVVIIQKENNIKCLKLKIKPQAHIPEK